MKTKTALVAAISLTFSGLSQAVITPGDYIETIPTITTPPPSGTITFDGLTDDIVPGDGGGPDMTTAGLNITAIQVTVKSTLAGTSTWNWLVGTSTGMVVKATNSITLDNFGFSHDGSDPTETTVSNQTAPLNVTAGDSGDVDTDKVETHVFNVTDIANFFNDPTFDYLSLLFSFQLSGTNSEPSDRSFQDSDDNKIEASVRYTVGPVIPEPSSALLGCTGLAALLLRRRR